MPEDQVDDASLHIERTISRSRPSIARGSSAPSAAAESAVGVLLPGDDPISERDLSRRAGYFADGDGDGGAEDAASEGGEAATSGEGGGHGCGTGVCASLYGHGDGTAVVAALRRSFSSGHPGKDPALSRWSSLGGCIKPRRVFHGVLLGVPLGVPVCPGVWRVLGMDDVEGLVLEISGEDTSEPAVVDDAATAEVWSESLPSENAPVSSGELPGVQLP